ncbi:out at first protein [Ischnura elegans]|uniref:out at first protein n=1 Tax=Ischnura elegans TaxID=197161 RepID=UPI001ED89E1E|nr:out at first protein [Ischnura elegans]
MCSGRYNFIYCVVVVYVLNLVTIVDLQLLINVKNQGGDVLQETISANVSEDTVTLEFQRPDGTLITQLVDFQNEVQILKALVLGEEERGQSQYQVMCFVCHFQKGEFISSDAMSKLRQKNPGAVRVPEEDRGREMLPMDLWVEVGSSTVSSAISHHIPTLCSEAVDATYAREADLELWANRADGSLSARAALLAAVKRFPPTVSPTPRCADLTTNTPSTSVPWTKPCICRLEICVGWYPCGLKYCKGGAPASGGKDGGPPAGPNEVGGGGGGGAEGGKAGPSAGSYRCGIKTCRKCRLFEYYVRQKQLCLWDE